MDLMAQYLDLDPMDLEKVSKENLNSEEELLSYLLETCQFRYYQNYLYDTLPEHYVKEAGNDLLGREEGTYNEQFYVHKVRQSDEESIKLLTSVFQNQTQLLSIKTTKKTPQMKFRFIDQTFKNVRFSEKQLQRLFAMVDYVTFCLPKQTTPVQRLILRSEYQYQQWLDGVELTERALLYERSLQSPIHIFDEYCPETYDLLEYIKEKYPCVTCVPEDADGMVAVGCTANGLTFHSLLVDSQNNKKTRMAYLFN